jgi:hypothetical protein
MATRTKSIRDLVKVVDRRLTRDGGQSPGLRVLTNLFEAVYFTSLKTEEGKPLQVRAALVDPAAPDPDRPRTPSSDRWKIAKIATPVPMTVANLVKLSKAADPWSSCLSVYYDAKGNLFIWGLVDQIVHSNTRLVREKETEYAPPGLFQMLATGPADVSVHLENEFVARLAQDTLSQRQSDVFSSGPIGGRLRKGIEEHVSAVWGRFGKKGNLGRVKHEDVWEFWMSNTWISTLCRILIGIQRYRHGGAVLITQSKADLDIKYKINYPRLRLALVRLWLSRLKITTSKDEIDDDYLDELEEAIPARLYLDKIIAEIDEEEGRDEITGCVRFIASLSCVDGLVLANPDLAIRGFGVEIRTRKEVGAVYLVPGPKARERSMQRIDPSHYGTRHRSMMRYCYAHPNSVGFVVSQDGEIRAMTRDGNRLLMWQNLKVLDFSKSFRHLSKKSS